MLRTHKDHEFIVTNLHICEFLFSSITPYPGIVTERKNYGVFPELGFCQERETEDGDQGVEYVSEILIRAINA